MPKISGTTSDVIAWSDQSCTVTLRRVTCKREAPRSDGDTGGVSATGTSILKSVRVLLSKWRGRVLVRKLFIPELVADPLFIDVPRGLGHSGDARSGLALTLVGVALDTAVSTCGAVWYGQHGTYQVTLESYEERPVWVNNTDPGHYLPWVHGRYRCGKLRSGNEVPREESCLVGSSWVSGIRRAQKDPVLLLSRDRFPLEKRILWSDQIAPST
ncbi:hypothetical protein TIFTF001_009556 [Ficus carica]|uniref:Uncharacterized protein n=1 Tax=Ficus carica TaxID=3494 RepID=A0AA88D3P9_FICCA|nr:hypothetical protein TIFTF001_009556 [Ficus carica]